MARIRTIKPEFWSDEKLSELPEPTHLLAAALLNYADDKGYFNANEKLVKAACSPLREPSVSIAQSLQILVGIGYLRIGVGPDGRKYGQVVSFDKHQKVNHPSPSRIESLAIVWEDSRNPPVILPEDSRLNGTGNREQGSGKEQGGGVEDATLNDAGTASGYPAEFEQFWTAYPRRDGRKRGKDKAFRIWKREIRSAERQELIVAATNYAQSEDSLKGFAKDAERFLKERWWADWLEAAEHPPPTSVLPTDEELKNYNPITGLPGLVL